MRNQRNTILGALAFAALLPLQSHASILFSDTQTISAPPAINAPGPFTFNFTVPTGAPESDATLLTTSLGDWSYQGAGDALASSESMSVTLDGVVISNDLFWLNANLDAGSPLKNDNSRAIFQSIVIPQALLATMVGDGALTLSYTPRAQVNIANNNSFITAGLSYRAATVPEPASLALVGIALTAMGFVRRKKS